MLASNDNALRTEQGIRDYMAAAKSEADWNKRCDDVKRANDGDYPAFWYFEIVLSGLAYETAKGWR